MPNNDHIKRSLVVELSREKISQAIEQYLGISKGHSIISFSVEDNKDNVKVTGCSITACASTMPHEVFQRIQNLD